MKIYATKNFMNRGHTYAKGQEYEVDDADGKKWVGMKLASRKEIKEADNKSMAGRVEAKTK